MTLTLEDLRTTRAKSGWSGVRIDPRSPRRPYVAIVRNLQREEIRLKAFLTGEQAAKCVLRALLVLGKAPYTWPRRSYCLFGHPLTESNVYQWRVQGRGVQRYCKKCRRPYQRAYQREYKQRRAPFSHTVMAIDGHDGSTDNQRKTLRDVGEMY